MTDPLDVVVEAARTHAAWLRARARDPFGMDNLPVSTSARGARAYSARLRAEADRIDAACAEVTPSACPTCGASGRDQSCVEYVDGRQVLVDDHGDRG